MKHEIKRKGVVAVRDGKYWGCQYKDGKSTYYDFGDIEKARISDSGYCEYPTDMTWRPKDGRHNPDYEKLRDAKLVSVTVTTIYETQE